MSRPSLRVLRLCIAFSLMAGSLLYAADSQQILRVFIMAGQSNMEGADAHANRIDEYPVFKGAGAPRLMFFLLRSTFRKRADLPSGDR